MLDLGMWNLHWESATLSEIYEDIHGVGTFSQSNGAYRLGFWRIQINYNIQGMA